MNTTWLDRPEIAPLLRDAAVMAKIEWECETVEAARQCADNDPEAFRKLKRELDRLRRKNAQVRKVARQGRRERLATGIVTDETPLPAEMNLVNSGSRSSGARRAGLWIGLTSAPCVWHGIEIPGGTHVHVPDGLGCIVGQRYEINLRGDGLHEVNFWQHREPALDLPTEPPPKAPRFAESEWANYFEPQYAEKLMSDSLSEEDLYSLNIPKKAKLEDLSA